jgi:hypothetical protein
MSKLLRLVILCSALLAPLPGVAAPVSVTPEEEATLRAGEVVIRELPTGSDGAVRVLAVVDIEAPPEAVWGALLDFQARKAANPAVQSVEPYKPATATELHYRWHISKYGADIVYHNRYVVDRAKGRMVHDLDAAQPNDLVASRGVYDLAPSPVNPACRATSARRSPASCSGG